MFDALTSQMDPNLVPDPMAFKPERWLADAVQARKGTPSTIIDHPFFSGPFSQGARRCPGSRVANFEVQAMIAQLLLDYKIEGPADMHWNDVSYKLCLLVEPKFPDQVRFVPR
jgi:cytochrome P450